MSSLPTQPYQVGDFSGGLTENFIAGGPTRYMAADNFWVTVDRKLEERYGSQSWLVAPQLPSGNAPVNALVTHDNEQFLLGVACPNIYVTNKNSLSLLGPTGNPPLVGGDYQNQISWGEWSHHTLITDDSLTHTPALIFRGAAYQNPAVPPYGQDQLTVPIPAVLNNFMAITAGLPVMVSTPASILPSALTNCILLANDLRKNMILHFSDYGPTENMNLHDSAGVAELTAQLAVLAASPIAIDQSSLFVLIAALIQVYGMHIFDVLQPVGGLWHWAGGMPGNFSLSDTNTPTNLIGAAAILDELKTKFFMHQMSPTAHDSYAQYALIGKYLVTTPHIGQITVGPILTPSYTQSLLMANQLKSVLNSHELSGPTYHKTPDMFDQVSFPDAVDLDSLYVMIILVCWSYYKHFLDSTEPGGGNYHYAVNTNQANESINQNLQYAPIASNVASWVNILTLMEIAYNYHDLDLTVHETAGLYPARQVTPLFGSYSFAMNYFYQYMRYDGVIFDIVGPPTLLGPVISEAISPAYMTTTTNENASGSIVSTFNYIPASTLLITDIPPLTQSGQSNYDIANVQIEIYRTIANGSTYYEEGLIPNGTTTFTSQLQDVANPNLANTTALNNQPTLYTTGGIVNFDPAPICKYITIMQNTAYFGYVIDAGQTFPNRIRQSIQNSIWASPGSFFIDLPDVLMGLSNTRNNLIAFCANSVFQISGLFNEVGQGSMVYQAISDTIGCVSGASIVRTDVGIFFAGTDGFYYTDGFQLIKLSSELNLTYAALVSNAAQKREIYGCYDRYNRRVWWSTQPDESDWSASQNYIFHVNFGVNANGVFTTASNGENYRPSSMIFWQGQQIRGDARGYLFLHSILNKADPQINIFTPTTAWNTVVIPYFYASCSTDFGTTFNRKWITRMAVQGKNEGNVGLQITSISDNGRVKPLPLSPILFRPNIMWGQPNLIWGAPNSVQPLVWDDDREMDGWRRFPATQLRADFKQVTFTPAFTGIYNYQQWPPGAGAQIIPLGGGVVQIFLITPPNFSGLVWPSDVVGYVFSQQGDNFLVNYPITGLTTTINTNDTLILSDPGNVLQASYVAWIIRGQLKQQRLSLTSYNIHFTLLGKMQHAYQGSKDSGENAPGTSYNQVVREHLITNSGQVIETNSGEEFDV